MEHNVKLIFPCSSKRLNDFSSELLALNLPQLLQLQFLKEFHLSHFLCACSAYNSLEILLLTSSLYGTGVGFYFYRHSFSGLTGTWPCQLLQARLYTPVASVHLAPTFWQYLKKLDLPSRITCENGVAEVKFGHVCKQKSAERAGERGGGGIRRIIVPIAATLTDLPSGRAAATFEIKEQTRRQRQLAGASAAVVEDDSCYSDYASIEYSSRANVIMSGTLSSGTDLMHTREGGSSSLGNYTLSSLEEDPAAPPTTGAAVNPSISFEKRQRLRNGAVHRHFPSSSAARFRHYRHSTSDDDSGCAIEDYAWVPSGLHPWMIQQYFSRLPEKKIPYVKSAGERWRVHQLLLQLPPQDNDARYCRSLSAKEEKELRIFSQRRKREALGRGTVQMLHRLLRRDMACRQCCQRFQIGEVAVFAHRLNSTTAWHPCCFVCHTCQELLIDLIYFHKDGNIYCGRHHAEILKPRCAACDEIIFADECIEAEGQSWHLNHFTCFECSVCLGGSRYVMRDSHPVCLPCYRTVYEQQCFACHQEIAETDARMSYGQRQWHANNSCFSCQTCGVPLLGRAFCSQTDGLYCGDAGCKSSVQTSQSGGGNNGLMSIHHSSSSREAIYRRTCFDRGELNCQQLKHTAAVASSSSSSYCCSCYRCQHKEKFSTDEEDGHNQRPRRHHPSNNNNNSHPDERCCQSVDNSGTGDPVYETIASNMNSQGENSGSSSSSSSSSLDVEYNDVEAVKESAANVEENVSTVYLVKTRRQPLANHLRRSLPDLTAIQHCHNSAVAAKLLPHAFTGLRLDQRSGKRLLLSNGTECCRGYGETETASTSDVLFKNKNKKKETTFAAEQCCTTLLVDNKHGNDDDDDNDDQLDEISGRTVRFQKRPTFLHFSANSFESDAEHRPLDSSASALFNCHRQRSASACSTCSSSSDCSSSTTTSSNDDELEQFPFYSQMRYANQARRFSLTAINKNNSVQLLQRQQHRSKNKRFFSGKEKTKSNCIIS
ncbi:Prickle-like protein [Trichinella spiralis]|uniref:Prickle-like protein n=1 Tax=Trichinella spiralis TaxID=6334 RepID=A0ABR3KJ57_TRISP